MTATSTPTAPNAAPLRLADLKRPLEPIELANGREVAVRKPTLVCYQQLNAADALTDLVAKLAAYLEVARWCVPSMTDEEAAALEVEEVLAIVAYASGRLNAVLDALGNAPAPAAADA